MKLVKWLAITVAALGVLLVGWMRLPRSLFYGESGPTGLGHATNRAMAWWSGTGLPPHRQVALEIRGRKSGKWRELPVVVATVDGQRYLVSMLGQDASWVANARAGGEAFLRHRGREAVRLEEVFGPERGPVLREYFRLAPGARPFIPVPQGAPEEEFVAVADGYPVFRVVGL